MQQEGRSERSRTQILEAALKLFSHRGYGATSVRDIAAAADVSKGNVYHHFSDKEAIFRALLDQYFQAISTPSSPSIVLWLSEPFQPISRISAVPPATRCGSTGSMLR